MAAEDIFVNGASGTLKRLVYVIANELSLVWGVKDELKRLEETLELITTKTSDAEKKQVNNAEVSLWLKRLKDAADDADDVLDEFSYETMRQDEKRSSKVKEFFSSSNQLVFRFKIAHKIKAINKKFNQIASDMKRFNFESTSGTSRCDDQTAEKRRRLTASFFGDDSKIVGREHDKSEIVKLLTSSSSINSSQQERVSVISIVGMGGLGKTTLAQSIFNSVEKHFQKTIWVCVSDEFDFYNILLNITESSTNSKCPEFSNITVLVDKVKKELENIHYLLVLDDVWNEDSMKWNDLKSVLDVGAFGSKIIVTTRLQEVASVVRGLIPPYNLNRISEAECWSIIRNKAFSPGGAYETPCMKSIGMEIAKKCGGLPLAATFFGGLMHSQNDERHWLSIRDNNSLETPENHSGGIIPILKLSYDNLPSHLKQCFSYCCLFPKDWKFDRETLIRLWIAEGFIHPRNGGNQSSLEDIGYGYFLNLLSSCFFQDLEKDDLGDIRRFKMHDLVHDLARSVLGKHEVMVLNASETQNDASQIRRLQLTRKGETSSTPVSNVLINAKKLRTVFYEGECYTCLSPFTNKRLRVIYPLGCNGSPKILSSPFKHLRYLDLNNSKIEDVQAASICQLYNLQTLNLYRSQNAQMVINGIGGLKYMRHLILSDSGVTVLPDSITRLTNLQTLDISSCYVQVLPDFIDRLTNLRMLDISFSRVEVLPDSITRLTNLQTLCISKTKITKLPINIGYLQNLEFLHMSRTKIRELPDSITRISNLKRLEMSNSWISALPSNFGALTQLRSLDLSHTGIRELPESLTSNLCKLEKVDLGSYCKIPKDIKNWVEVRYLKCATESETRGIEMLTRLEILDSYFVRKEDGGSDSSGIEELANLNSLQKLNIKQLENVRGETDAERAKLKDMQNMRELGLFWSPKEEELVRDDSAIMVLDGLQPHPNLKDLRITFFPGSKFPKWMGSASCLSNLVKLYLQQCTICEKFPALGMLPCLKRFHFSELHSVKCLGEEFYYQEQEIQGSAEATTTSSFPSLVSLSFSYMRNLETWVNPPSPHNSFPILEDLCITGCDKLSSVPDLRLLTSLRKLDIERCKKLAESIPYDLKKSLSFLKELYVKENPTRRRFNLMRE